MTTEAPTSTCWFAGSLWHITRHARLRWQERYEPEARASDVARRLSALSQGALDTGAETRDGRPLYLHPDWPAVRFVVARPTPPETRPTLVTVVDAAALAVARRPDTRREWRRRRGA